MPCEPMSSTATNAKCAKSCDGAQNVGQLGSTTGCPVSLSHGGLVWPLTPEGNGTQATVGSVATGGKRANFDAITPEVCLAAAQQAADSAGPAVVRAAMAPTATKCPPCNGKCREGRDCPAREYETDAERAAYMIVSAVLWGLIGWAAIAAAWAAAGLIAG